LTLVGYIKVTRPPLTILGGLAPLALVLWSGKPLVWEGLLIILAVFFGNMGYTMLNEVMDAETDAKNKPWKPIPSGQVDMEKVLVASVFLAGCSLASLIVLGLYFNWFYSVGAWGLLLSHVYNVLRKDVLGNICMSGAYGIAALISLYPKYLEFSLAFALLTFAFNLAVQYQDLEAEKTSGVVTAPQQLGVAGTVFLGALTSVISFMLFARLYEETLYFPLVFFKAASFITLISAGSICVTKPESTVHELLNRYLGRIFLLIGFIDMIMLEVMG